LPDRYFALIPCAGTGSRSGADVPKQYKRIGAHPMVWYALAAFSACPAVASTTLVLALDDIPLDRRFAADTFAGLRFDTVFCGGASRQASVRNGLDHLLRTGATAQDWVLVHDAARPGLMPALIDTLIGAVESDGPDAAIGGILALPVPDTLKRGTEDEEGKHMRVAGTVARDGLWQAQTPQMFRLGVLREALDQAEARGLAVTDEASAVEQLGLRPKLVIGALRNFKVTYPDDFALAQALLAHIPDTP
jgi:2-C-methyl-D-erythritol 4-phosphate cytidylyltransferase